jgi:hypothetical protein
MAISDTRAAFLRQLAGVVLGILLGTGPGIARADSPVTETDLTAMKLIHYYPLPDRKLHGVDFQWSFQDRSFTVKKGDGAIPADLLATLLPGGEKADEVRGDWTLKDGSLVLSNIKAGKLEGRKDVRLSVYKTAPTVVRIGHTDSQYVFGIGD